MITGNSCLFINEGQPSKVVLSCNINNSLSCADIPPGFSNLVAHKLQGYKLLQYKMDTK